MLDQDNNFYLMIHLSVSKLQSPWDPCNPWMFIHVGGGGEEREKEREREREREGEREGERERERERERGREREREKRGVRN